MKWYKNFVVFWTIIYLLVAIVGRFTTSNHEIFPFFRWSLYSKTPNALTFPYVLVTKIGDSILTQPVNILDLHQIHHISLVDMNLNVNHFYKDVKKSKANNKDYQGDFFKILPANSDFELYVKMLDLTKKNYTDTEENIKILSVKDNSQLNFER